MTHYFTSLEQIKEMFQIAEDTPEAIRESLRRRQYPIHPDRNEGRFASERDEMLFHELASAIDFIDHKNDVGALVSVSAVTDLAKAVTDLVKAQSPLLPNILSEQVKDEIRSYRSRFRFPRIALSAITVALGTIWLFPKTLNDNRILSKWLDPSSIVFGMIWLYVLLITVFFWCFFGGKMKNNVSFKKILRRKWFRT